MLSIYFGGIPFFILMLLVVLFSIHEYYYIISRTGFDVQQITGYAFGVLIFASVFFNGTELLTKTQGQLSSIMLTLCLFVFSVYEIIRVNFSKTQEVSGSIVRIALTFFGVFLISWTFCHILLIRDINPGGVKYTFFLFLLIWISDTGAYVIGKKFGRIKLAEKISPNKTVEGLVGAVITGIIAGLIMWKVMGLNELRLAEVASISALIALFAGISDLAESLLKRDVGLKDTDVLLPGHGGMLDRFDSFIFTAPFFFYYLTIFHK